MIRRISERDDFERIAREGVRVRRSALWCTSCPASESVAVAFAVSRALGPAVTRNLVRRRLRSLLREADKASPLPVALLLISVRPPAIELTFDQLRVELGHLITQVRRSYNTPC